MESKFEEINNRATKATFFIKEINNLKEKSEEAPILETKLQNTIKRIEKVISASTKDERIEHFGWLVQGSNYLGEKMRDVEGGSELINKIDEAIEFIRTNYDVRK